MPLIACDVRVAVTRLAYERALIAHSRFGTTDTREALMSALGTYTDALYQRRVVTA